jgi:hypothetical protein
MPVWQEFFSTDSMERAVKDVNKLDAKNSSAEQKRTPFFQPGLAVNEPDNIMRMPDPSSNKNRFFKPAANIIQRQGKNPPGWDDLHNFKNPGSVTVKFTHFKTKNVTTDPFGGYSTKAAKLLKEHNLGLDVIEGGEVDYQSPLQIQDDIMELREAVDKLGKDTTTRLAVISAVWSANAAFNFSDLNGETFKGTKWPNFVVLNVANTSADNVTALHEAGHAANVPGRVDLPVSPTDAVQNFMLYGNDRTDMIKPQVIAMANAYFSK